MENRLFLLDKNYILKQAQRDARPEMLRATLKEIKDSYFEQHNPLRLMDTTSKKIDAFDAEALDTLVECYQILAGIYRYHIGHNQLELLFDGSSHYDKYLADWSTAYLEYVKTLCRKRTFLLAALELTVFLGAHQRIELIQNRLKLSIFDHFGLKVYKHKGIRSYQIKTA